MALEAQHYSMEQFDLIQSSTLTTYLTPEGYEKLQKELDYLVSNKRVEISNRMRESKQHGEYSEDNSELEGAKLEQAIIESQIAELKAVFANVQLLQTKDIPVDYVGMGSFVTLKDNKEFSFTIRIVSSIEADPENDLVSNESPLGQALIEHKIGDSISYEAPAGKLQFEILKISNQG